MASERWLRSRKVAFIADGTIDGKVKVLKAKGFKVKSRVIIQSSTKDSITVEIKAITDKTTIYVGPCGSEMETRSDLSGFTVADGATIYLVRQKRWSISKEEYTRATYSEEPTVAWRVIPVDWEGEVISDDNPLPITGEISVSQSGVHTPHVINLPVTSLLEHQLVIPQRCKRFILRQRESSIIRIASNLGETSTLYFTLNFGCVLSEELLKLTGDLTLYLRSNKIGTIEILWWE
jgi:hypothetical protein